MLWIFFSYAAPVALYSSTGSRSVSSPMTRLLSDDGVEHLLDDPVGALDRGFGDPVAVQVLFVQQAMQSVLELSSPAVTGFESRVEDISKGGRHRLIPIARIIRRSREPVFFQKLIAAGPHWHPYAISQALPYLGIQLVHDLQE